MKLKILLIIIIILVLIGCSRFDEKKTDNSPKILTQQGNFSFLYEIAKLMQESTVFENKTNKITE